MKIIIDSEIFTSQKRGGISRHFSNLIKSFKSQKSLKIYLNSYFHSNLHLKEEKISIYLPSKFIKLIKNYSLFAKIFTC